MTKIELKSRVGADGVLKLRVPVGLEEANREVRVTVESVGQGPDPAADREEWKRFIDETYGSCSDLGLEEPEDLPCQERDWPQ